MTRFSKDIVVLDLFCPAFTVTLTYGIFRTISVAISVSLVNPIVIVPCIFAMIYLVCIMRRAKTAMIESQRLDALVRGPIHSLFAMVVNGLITIRAYKKIGHFEETFLRETEMSANVTFTYITANRWLGFRFDSAVFILCQATAIFALVMKDQLDGALLIFTL
jgi:hypothetical protein